MIWKSMLKMDHYLNHISDQRQSWNTNLCPVTYPNSDKSRYTVPRWGGEVRRGWNWWCWRWAHAISNRFDSKQTFLKLQSIPKSCSLGHKFCLPQINDWIGMWTERKYMSSAKTRSAMTVFWKFDVSQVSSSRSHLSLSSSVSLPSIARPTSQSLRWEVDCFDMIGLEWLVISAKSRVESWLFWSRSGFQVSQRGFKLPNVDSSQPARISVKLVLWRPPRQPSLKYNGATERNGITYTSYFWQSLSQLQTLERLH